MRCHRTGSVELQMWRDGQPITRLMKDQLRTDPNFWASYLLPPDGIHLPDCYLVQVELRARMPLGDDWLLTELRTVFNNNVIGQCSTALRFAHEPDPWPTAVQPLIIPLINDLPGRPPNVLGFETWYLTIRGDGSEDQQ